MVISMNNGFQIIGLYDHNVESYRKIAEAFSEENIVAIVHATGTGKSYNALQLAYDNKDKNIVYVVPSNGIIEHLKKIIDDNPKLDIIRNFPNLKFRTYQSFVNMSLEEIKEVNVDMLILDEFQHSGAPEYTKPIDYLEQKNPFLYVFGLSATPIRDFDFQSYTLEDGSTAKGKKDMAEQRFHGDVSYTSYNVVKIFFNYIFYI